MQPEACLVDPRPTQVGRVVALEEGRVDLARQPRRRPQHPHQQVAVGGDPVEPGARQGCREPTGGLLAGGAVSHDLGQHRVVVDADHRPGSDTAVDADAVDGRELEPVQRPGRRQEPTGRVLGVHARLHGVPGQVGVEDRRGQRLPPGDEQLQRDEVQAGHQLGHRVLDLQPGVHLQEGRSPVQGQHELDGPGAGVADGLRRRDRRVAQAGAQGGVDGGGGRLLQHLLMAALHRAVPLEQRDAGPVLVGHDLHLDVPGPLDVALEEHRPVAERRGGLPVGTLDGLREIGCGSDDPHPAPAATRAGLDQDRVADALARSGQVGRGQPGRVDAGQAGHPGADHQRLRRQLVAHGRDGAHRRADPGEPRGEDVGGETGVLGQEPVAGMDCVRARGQRGGDEEVAAQVGLTGGVARQPYGRVGFVHVGRVGVGVAEDRDGREPLRAGGAEDAARDLPAVGDQQAAHHILHTP